LLLATDDNGNTAWQMAADSGEVDVLQNIWNWAKENLKTEEMKNNFQ
jgi:endo-1,4-beta-D-glucanase Y